jgi:hypothetical protein
LPDDCALWLRDRGREEGADALKVRVHLAVLQEQLIFPRDDRLDGRVVLDRLDDVEQFFLARNKDDLCIAGNNK